MLFNELNIHGIAWYCIVCFGILYYLFCMLLRRSLCRAGCVSQHAYSLNIANSDSAIVQYKPRTASNNTVAVYVIQIAMYKFGLFRRKICFA